MAEQFLVESPYIPFTIKNQFKAVSNGLIYIGEVDKDPLNPLHQIDVYVVDETGQNVQVSQPIEINAGGFPVYNGQVSKFVTLQPYSLVVLNKNGGEEWRVDNILKEDPDNIKYTPLVGPEFTCDGIKTEFDTAGKIIYPESLHRIYLDGVRQFPINTVTGERRWGVYSPGKVTFLSPPDAGVQFSSEIFAPATTSQSNSLVFETFSALINSDVDMSTVSLCRTAQHTSGGVGAASYTKDGTSGTPNTGNEAKFYDAQGNGWVITGTIELSMMGGVADDTFINNAALVKAAQASDVCILDGKIGTYRFSGSPLLPSTFTTLIFGQSAITGVTADKVNGRLLDKGVLAGIPYTPELGYNKIEIVAGTLRQNQFDQTKWDWIKDGAHEPIGVIDSVPATAEGSKLIIDFTKTYTKVISFIAAPDEALANAIGFKCGSSVGLSKAEIKASVNQVMSAQIWYDGAAWQWEFSQGQGGPGQHGVDISSITFNSGHITVNHDVINGTNISVVPWTQEGAVLPLPIHVRSLSPETRSTFTVGNWSGGVTTTPSTNMSFIYTKHFDGGIFMDGSNGSGSYELWRGNIWFYGIFMV